MPSAAPAGAPQYSATAQAGFAAAAAGAINLFGQPINPSELGKLMREPQLPDEVKVTPSKHANAKPEFMCSTVNAFPATPQLLAKSKLPFGLVMAPFRMQTPDEEQVPVIQASTIVRCKRCRTYINPFVNFVDQGMRWRCNMCFCLNDGVPVPGDFDFDPATQRHIDRMQRAELTHGVVEFIAPSEYMVRPPQPPVYLFVIDVSYNAVNSGMVAAASRAILDNIDAIPNREKRTRVGIITVDSSVHFYNLNPSLSQPQMYVVSDLDDMFLPQPEDLLANLAESEQPLTALLERMPEMFKTTHNNSNALGAALQAAVKLTVIGLLQSMVGGKIVVFQAVMPNIGPGALTSREDPKIFGTPKESAALDVVADSFYKNLAVECSRAHISMDVFLFPHAHIDLATLGAGPRFTGGSLYTYPNFSGAVAEDVVKFATDYAHFISRPYGLEAVMRVRASKGVRMTGYHGHFFIRSMDLLALPGVSPDNAYAYQLTLDEPIQGNVVCFQAGLLYTTSFGERRIRVLTLALPVTNDISTLYSAANAPAMANLLGKMAVERSLTAKIEDARDALVYKVIEILAVYRSNFAKNIAGTILMVPEQLRHLPLMILSLIKHTAFRAGGRVPLDERAWAMSLLRVMPVELSNLFILPNLYALHLLDAASGLPGPDGQTVLPLTQRLSSEVMERHGIYLLDDGQVLRVWVGRAVSGELCRDLFDVPSYDAIRGGKTTLPELPNSFSQRVHAIVRRIREGRPTYSPLVVCKEDGDAALRAGFLSLLVEDKTDRAMSYQQFLQHLREKVVAESS